MREEKAILRGARFLALENDAQFWQQTMTDPYLQAAVTALGQVLGRVDDTDMTSEEFDAVLKDAPEVEVTYDSSSLPVEVPQTGLVRRRSGARNVSDEHLQNAFIEESRAAMGQPGLREAETFLNERVILTFNHGVPPRTGVLTDIVEQPANLVYLILDDDMVSPIPLNSVQSIKLDG